MRRGRRERKPSDTGLVAPPTHEAASLSLPVAPFVPGQSSPRARSRSRAYLAARLAGAWSEPFDPEGWRENLAWRLGLDLFHAGFFWEAHEAWEPLWRRCPPHTAERALLRGLLQWAASGVQLAAGRMEAARRTAEKTLVTIAALQASGTVVCLGVDVSRLAVCLRRFLRLLHHPRKRISRPTRASMRIPLCD